MQCGERALIYDAIAAQTGSALMVANGAGYLHAGGRLLQVSSASLHHGGTVWRSCRFPS